LLQALLVSPILGMMRTVIPARAVGRLSNTIEPSFGFVLLATPVLGGYCGGSVRKLTRA
jgi:hypothetical protein